MKKLTTVVAFMLLYVALQAQVTYQVTFRTADYGLTSTKNIVANDTTYTRLNLPVYPVDAVPGYPELPVKYVKLIIPPGQDVSNIKITSTTLGTQTLTSQVYPIQEPVPVGVTSDDFTSPSSTIYKSSGAYPAKTVQLVNDGYFNGCTHVATFAVYPMQYYPLKKQLVKYNSITFTVTTGSTKSSGLQPIAPNQFNPMYNKTLGQIVANPADSAKYATDAYKITSSLKSGVPYYEYVVVTSSSLSSAFANFVAWKKLKGYNIGVVTWQSIRSNYPGGDLISGINDTAGSIRQYLRDAWANGTVYCLIGGDMDIVPGRFGTGSWDTWDPNPNVSFDDGDYKIPADLYYSDFNGDWNIDNDIYLGERPTTVNHTGDNVDFNPEIFVGRLLVNSASQVAIWFKKLKIYENCPGLGDYGYLQKVLFTQADGIGYSSVLSHLNWTSNITFMNEYPGNYAPSPTYPKGADVITEFNQHYGLASWFNHGSSCTVGMATDSNNTTPYYCISAHKSTDCFVLKQIDVVISYVCYDPLCPGIDKI